MPITPRTPSNPALDLAVLQAWTTIALGYPTLNVNLANSPANVNGNGPIYIKKREEMLASDIWPAGYVRTAHQTHRRVSSTTYDGTLAVILDYCDVWEPRTDGLTYEQVRDLIALDLERIRSNLQENEQLAVGNNNPLTVSLLTLDLSDDENVIEDQAGHKLIYRRAIFHYLLMDYDA